MVVMASKKRVCMRMLEWCAWSDVVETTHTSEPTSVFMMLMKDDSEASRNAALLCSGWTTLHQRQQQEHVCKSGMTLTMVLT